ncbi:MAG: cupin domain-containing protein, partial [Nitrospinota bacterium]
MSAQDKPQPKVMRAEEAFWELPPGHFQAFSKLLVHPTNAHTRYFDFRISSYQPRGYAEVHVHEVAENIYYILQGKGIVELDGVRHLVEPHTVVHIPPGVRHGI